MTKVHLMVLMRYHLGLLPIDDGDEIKEVINVLDVTHELEPFLNGEEVTEFLKLLLFENGIPAEDKEELAPKLDKAGKKWFWWVIEGRVREPKAVKKGK